MHEMSLVTSLLSIIREEMERHALHRLLQVRVRYGALANIVPEALSVAFEALTAGTDWEGAVLQTERNPPLAQVFPNADKSFPPLGRNVFRHRALSVEKNKGTP